MPYAILPVDGGFKVVNTSTGAVHAENTSRENAEAQLRLLRGIEHNPGFAKELRGPSAKSGKGPKELMPVRRRKRKMKSEGRDMGTTQEPMAADSVGQVPPVPRKG